MEQYAQALLGRQQAVEKLSAIQRELHASWQELRKRMSAGCPASHLSQFNDYHRALKNHHDEANTALGVAERRVNAAMQTMLSARQQREIVDKSREKQKARHLREQFRAEQKVLDDIAGRRGGSSLSWNATEALS